MPKMVSAGEAGRARGGFGQTHCPLPVQPNYEDQENRNLSWLLDFKLDSFIEAPEDKSAAALPRDANGTFIS